MSIAAAREEHPDTALRSTASRWSLRRRLAVACTLFAALTVASFSIAGIAYARQVHARERIIGVLDPARLGVGNLLTDYLDEETGVRGYVLTQEKTFLQPYDAALTSAKADRAHLGSLLRSEPAALQLLAATDRAVARWQRQFALPALATTAAGKTTYRSAAHELVGKNDFDAVRSSFSRLDAALRADAASALGALNASQLTVFIAAAIALAILLAASAGAFAAMRAWVTRPLDALSSDARLVAAGDLEHAVRPVGPPDLALLGTDVESMRRRIFEEVAQLEAARVQLEATVQELHRSNADLEQFAYVASHDLQEPLRKVASFCSLLQSRYGGQLDERADEYIAFAVDGATRMQQLINDLLAFSRVGRRTAAFTPVALDEAVRLAQVNLRSAIEETGARIDVGALPEIDGDLSLLVALFQNLVGNSIKFRGLDPPLIHVTAAREGADWEIAVEDNGIGIDARFAERVFIIFQRLHSRERYPGTGIGLALCKKIVEFHGGRIWIDTARAAGTRIVVKLPARRW